MGRSLALLAFLSLPLLFGALSPTAAKKTDPKYTPPDIAAGNYITYPINSEASGVVVIAVHLDGAGQIKKTEVLRDIPSLTAPVLTAVNNWTFKPATLRGKAVDSTIIVNIAYNPSDYRLGGTNNPALGKELTVLPPDAEGFLPPRVLTASWAAYPLDSVAQGSVMLDARVTPEGRVTRVIPVWEAQALTAASIDAAKSWTFEPASLNGEHIVANTVIGYVFRLPNVASPFAKP